MKVFLSSLAILPALFSAAQGESYGNFTLNNGLSYELYRYLAVTPTAVSGGTVKTVASQDVRLDCFHAPRYTCVVTAPRSMLRKTEDGMQFLRLTDSAFANRTFATLNVTGSDIRGVKFNEYSFACNASYCEVILHPAPPPPPVEPYPPYDPYPGNNCSITTETCTYAGYCWHYSYGRYVWDYSTWCSGYRQVQSCRGGIHRTQCGPY